MKSYHNIKTLLAVIACSFSLYSCANIQQPSGGPKDTIPPKLVSTSPENNLVNFKSKKIILHFDKLIKLINPQREIVITPEMAVPPIFMERKKDIIALIENENLKENTTYSINFGKSIADITEGNLAEPYKYVFSTGPHLDSLSINGKVIYDLDPTKIKDVFVGIYSTTNADVLKDSPLWFTYTNELGEFNFTNLSKGVYKIYAFTNQDGSRRFDYKKLLGFLNTDIDLDKNLRNINLVMSKQIPDKITIEEKDFKNPKICLTLNAEVDPKDIEYSSKSNNNNQTVNLILATETPSSTICFFPSTTKFNSLEIKLGNKEIGYDTTIVTNYNPGAQPTNLNMSANLNGSSLTDSELILSFSAPIEAIEKDKIQLIEEGRNIKDFDIKPFSINDQLNYQILYNWNQDQQYTIVIPLQAIKDIYGGENVEFKREFFVSNSKDLLGSIKMNVTIPDKHQYIVRLMGEAGLIIKESIINESSTVDFSNIAPGGYTVLFIDDLNKNSKWDMASFTKNIQAEPATIYPGVIDVRANWEINQNYSLIKDTDSLSIENKKDVGSATLNDKKSLDSISQ